MNTLTPAKQAQIIAAICEGASICATARQSEVSKNTDCPLADLVATAAERYMDEAFRNLDINRVQTPPGPRNRMSFVPGSNHATSTSAFAPW